MRLEKDSIGSLYIDDNAYYGIQSLRGADNFNVIEQRIHPDFVKNIAKIKKAAAKVKAFLSVELNMGQMVDDVKLAINCAKPVYFYGRTGGVLMTPDEVLNKLVEIEKGEAKEW